MLSLRTRRVLGLFSLLSAIASGTIFFTTDVKHPGMFVMAALTLVGTAIVGRLGIALQKAP